MFIKNKLLLIFIFIIGILILNISIFAVANEEDSILDRIMEERVIRVGFPPNMLNWSIVNPNTGEWEGICVDIMNHLAEQMEVKIEHKSVDWQAFPLELNNRTIDIFAGTAQYTVPRAMAVCFTYPVFWKGMGFLTLTENADKYASLEDIDKEGVRIAVGIGTAGDQLAEYYYPNAETYRMRSGSHSELIEAIVAGQADLAVIDHLAAWDHGNKFDHITMPTGAVAPSLHSFMIAYGDHKWQTFLDTYFMQITQSDLVDQIAKKWYPEMPDEVRDIRP